MTDIHGSSLDSVWRSPTLDWFVNGAIASLLVVTLLMARLIGWKPALAFAAYIGAGVIFVANNQGHLNYLLWPEIGLDREMLNFASLLVAVGAGVQFSRTLPDLNKLHPALDRLAWQYHVLLAALLLAWPFLSDVLAFRIVVIAAFVFGITFCMIEHYVAWRARLLAIQAVIVGSSAFLATVGLASFLAIWPRGPYYASALEIMHFLVLGQSLAFFIGIPLRMVGLQRALNRSLANEVASTRDRLALAEALNESRIRYDEARKRAERLRTRLASTTHDIQQPLLSLRQVLADRTIRDGDLSERLTSTLNFLEKVTASGLADARTRELDLSGEKPDKGQETFPISVVLENCMAMFRGEAEEAGISFELHSNSADIHTDPIGFMRALNNLIANALRHAGAGRVLVAARERYDHVLVQVIDNGRGLDNAEIADLCRPFSKSDDSSGEGLGLAIVTEFGCRPGHDFQVRARMGRGSCFSLVVPKHPLA